MQPNCSWMSYHVAEQVYRCVWPSGLWWAGHCGTSTRGDSWMASRLLWLQSDKDAGCTAGRPINQMLQRPSLTALPMSGMSPPSLPCTAPTSASSATSSTAPRQRFFLRHQQHCPQWQYKRMITCNVNDCPMTADVSDYEIPLSCKNTVSQCHCVNSTVCCMEERWEVFFFVIAPFVCNSVQQ